MQKFCLEPHIKQSSWCILGNQEQRSNVIKILLPSLSFDRMFEFGEKKLTCRSYDFGNWNEVIDRISYKKNQLASVLILENGLPVRKSEDMCDLLNCLIDYKTSLCLGLTSLQQYLDLNNSDYLIWFSDNKETDKIHETFFPDITKTELAATLHKHNCFIMDNYNREPKLYYFKYTLPKETIYHAFCNDRGMCENLDFVKICISNYMIPDLVNLIMDFVHTKRHICCSYINSCIY
jgi:hypothetical protein